MPKLFASETSALTFAGFTLALALAPLSDLAFALAGTEPRELILELRLVVDILLLGVLILGKVGVVGAVGAVGRSSSLCVDSVGIHVVLASAFGRALFLQLLFGQLDEDAREALVALRLADGVLVPDLHFL